MVFWEGMTKESGLNSRTKILMAWDSKFVFRCSKDLADLEFLIQSSLEGSRSLLKKAFETSLFDILRPETSRYMKGR